MSLPCGFCFNEWQHLNIHEKKKKSFNHLSFNLWNFCSLSPSFSHNLISMCVKFFVDFFNYFVQLIPTVVVGIFFFLVFNVQCLSGARESRSLKNWIFAIFITSHDNNFYKLNLAYVYTYICTYKNPPLVNNWACADDHLIFNAFRCHSCKSNNDNDVKMQWTKPTK